MRAFASHLQMNVAGAGAFGMAHQFLEQPRRGRFRDEQIGEQGSGRHERLIYEFDFDETSLEAKAHAALWEFAGINRKG